MRGDRWPRERQLPAESLFKNQYKPHSSHREWCLKTHFQTHLQVTKSLMTLPQESLTQTMMLLTRVKFQKSLPRETDRGLSGAGMGSRLRGSF